MPSFEHVRSTRIAAAPAVIRALVEDFRAWTRWSPWENIDASLQRTYSGAEKGVGARYAWVGKKAGAGSMAITGLTDDRVDVDLDFERPIKANNRVVFRLEPDGDGTKVTWTMTGNRNLLLALMGKLHFDGMVLRDFERGLAQLKTAAEAPAR